MKQGRRLISAFLRSIYGFVVWAHLGFRYVQNERNHQVSTGQISYEGNNFLSVCLFWARNTSFGVDLMWDFGGRVLLVPREQHVVLLLSGFVQ